MSVDDLKQADAADFRKILARLEAAMQPHLDAVEASGSPREARFVALAMVLSLAHKYVQVIVTENDFDRDRCALLLEHLQTALAPPPRPH